MEFLELKQLVDEKLSTYKIAEKLSCSQVNVRYWLKKFNLKTFIPEKMSVDSRKHNQVLAVSKRRKKIKLMAIEYKGGKCVKCGYNKCVDALEFHHLSLDKDFNIGTKGYTRSWDKVKIELDKCILLCANCHREEHNKINNNGVSPQAYTL